MSNVVFLADCHIGRRFRAGVPLGRAGERDALQRKAFADFFDKHEQDDVIVLGDLFDSVNVSNEDLLFVANVLNRRSEFVNTIILAGNHDISRSDKISSFDVLSKMSTKADFVQGNTAIWGDYSLVPFSYRFGVEELVRNLSYKTKYLCGHFSDKDVPFLSTLGYEHIYSGHLHNYFDPFVEFVPAMLPLNHLEARNDDLYITYNSVDEFLKAEPETYKNKCVRVIGKDLSIEDVDCLQFQVVRKEEIESASEVEFDGFDARSIFEECMKDVDEKLKGEIYERLDWK